MTTNDFKIGGLRLYVHPKIEIRTAGDNDKIFEYTPSDCVLLKYGFIFVRESQYDAFIKGYEQLQASDSEAKPNAALNGAANKPDEAARNTTRVRLNDS